MGLRQNDCESCAVRHRAICSALSDEDITRLNGIARTKRFEAGQVILRDQETIDYVATVVSGVIKLSKTLADGRQQIVALQFPSDFIGRPFRNRSRYFAEAASDVTLCTFERSRFERLMVELPGIERRLFEHTLDELDAAQDWMVLLGRKTAAEKLASFLVHVARRTSQIGCNPQSSLGFVKFELVLSRSEIADFLGLTIETISRQMSALKRAGIIGLEGARTVVVPDIGRLQKAAEEAQD